MQLPSPNLAVFPAIEGNLEGFDEVRLEIQVDSPKFALDPLLSIEELRRRIEATLKRAALIVNPVAPQALVVAIYVEPRDFAVATAQNQTVVFFISTAVREVGSVTRQKLGQPSKSFERVVDSWRHKGLRGFAPLDIALQRLSTILAAEVDLQVDEFIAAWRRDSNVAAFMPPSPAPIDPLAGLRSVKVPLGKIDLGNEDKEETITIVNPVPPPAPGPVLGGPAPAPVPVNSTIKIKFVRSVTAELHAEILGPSALIDGARPLITQAAEEAAAKVTLKTIADDPAAATPAFRDEFLDRVSKASALEKVREHFAVDAADTVAVGDHRNDIEMLGWAGRGVAMGQAPDDVKAVADEVTGTVEEDGLAQVLESL